MGSPASSPSNPTLDADGGGVARDDPALVARGLVLVDVLGLGGHSVVYRAHDTRHGRDVAIKVLRTDVAERAAARFEREIRVAGGMRHPHILPLFDSGTLGDGRPFSVMPVAQGRPLRAMIDEGALPVEDALRLTREVGEALAVLHDRGWVHRDVKPENILVESGHAVLTDFGLALPVKTVDTPRTSAELEALLAGTTTDSRLTAANHVVGTPLYMSPEAMWGDAPIDQRSDLYSLALVLYEMLAASLPFKGDTFVELAREHAHRSLPRITTVRTDAPRALDEILARASAPSPDARYDGIVPFLEALRGVGAVAGVAPGRRRRSEGIELRDVALILSLLALLGAGIGGLIARRARALDPQRVVVSDFGNDTGTPSLDRLGVFASDVVTAALARDRRLDVVNADVAVTARAPSTVPAADSVLSKRALALVKRTRAGVLVTGSYIRIGDDASRRSMLEIVSQVTDTRSGRILGVAGPIATRADHPDAALRTLGDSIAAIIARRHAPPA